MKNKIKRFAGSPWGQRLEVLLAIALIMLVFQPRFFLLSNFRSIFISVAVYGVMACGMLIVMISGGIDLCIGSTAGMAACLVTKTIIDSGYTDHGMAIGLCLALGFCLIFGLAQGLAISYLGLHPFVVTYATMYAVYGLAIVYTNNSYLQPGIAGLFFNLANYKLLGVPMLIYWFILFCIITGVLLGCTNFGRRIYAVGGNRRAAELVGINAKKYSCIAYVLCSVFVGIGGILLASQNTMAFSETARGYHGKVLTALVVGGVSTGGGEGSIGGALFGAFFVAILSNAMILLDVPSEFQHLVEGVVIVVAIAMNVFSRRKADAALAKEALPENQQTEA